MADLAISGTQEEQHAVMKALLIQLWAAVKGNGKDGLEIDVTNIHLELRDIKAYGKTTAFLGKLIAGLLSLLIIGIGTYFTYLEVSRKSSELIPSHQISSSPEAISSKQQISGGFDPLNVQQEGK